MSLLYISKVYLFMSLPYIPKIYLFISLPYIPINTPPSTQPNQQTRRHPYRYAIIHQYYTAISVACLIYILSEYSHTKFKFNCTFLETFNTLRTGLLNCLNARSRGLKFRHRASCIQGQAFRYSPENAFYIFNQQIYSII